MWGVFGKQYVLWPTFYGSMSRCTVIKSIVLKGFGYFVTVNSFM